MRQRAALLCLLLEDLPLAPESAKNNLSRGYFDPEFLGGPGDAHFLIFYEVNQSQSLLCDYGCTWYEILQYFLLLWYNFSPININQLYSNRASR